MSTEEATCRGHTCDSDEHNTMAEASSQAAGDRGSAKSPRGHIDFAPEMLLGTQDVRGRTFYSHNEDRDNYDSSYQSDSSRRCEGYDS